MYGGALKKDSTIPDFNGINKQLCFAIKCPKKVVKVEIAVLQKKWALSFFGCFKVQLKCVGEDKSIVPEYLA